jgi:hypothetical protein
MIRDLGDKSFSRPKFMPDLRSGQTQTEVIAPKNPGTCRIHYFLVLTSFL